MSTRNKPEGYPAVSPYFLVPDADRFMHFVKTVFDAEEIMVYKDGAGRVMHAELRIDDSVIMLGNSTAVYPPQPGAVFMYVKDTDDTYRKALAEGARPQEEPADKDYGRSAGVFDAFGNSWWFTSMQ
ncbi:VOC family protein [Chitinophaga lutea]|uniref:VOC family protein n=1 Tax=Chitinophaga lutea TaxID=2488634 RepID=A0A3N4PK33_9BACT|nr:VOC family protein [Chitinophaga lutea]RPE09032.1 VOC family protein [Chitinophaga lutea]